MILILLLFFTLEKHQHSKKTESSIIIIINISHYRNQNLDQEKGVDKKHKMFQSVKSELEGTNRQKERWIIFYNSPASFYITPETILVFVCIGNGKNLLLARQAFSFCNQKSVFPWLVSVQIFRTLCTFCEENEDHGRWWSLRQVQVLYNSLKQLLLLCLPLSGFMCGCLKLYPSEREIEENSCLD